MRLWFLTLALVAAALAPATGQARPRGPAGVLDAAPRTAVMTAMPSEMAALRPALTHPRRIMAGGVEFWLGEIEGRPVVLFLSGVSMTNAAVNTQLALDRFVIRRIVFSGVAGGVDPALHVGDVVVPARWAPYMEAVFERSGPERPRPPGLAFAPFGMMRPHPWPIIGPQGPETRFWFPADPALLEVARRSATTTPLRRCLEASHCLPEAPRIVIGGGGLSAPVFMDNAEYRAYLAASFAAQAVDMESAAVAQVAYMRGVPFIAFRSLSDLAGGDPGENGFSTFVSLAADNAATTLRAFLRALPD